MGGGGWDEQGGKDACLTAHPSSLPNLPVLPVFPVFPVLPPYLLLTSFATSSSILMMSILAGVPATTFFLALGTDFQVADNRVELVPPGFTLEIDAVEQGIGPAANEDADLGITGDGVRSTAPLASMPA
jgi:hypothetical protein